MYLIESDKIKLKDLHRYGSQDSAVGIATGYGLDDRGIGVRVPVISRIFYSTWHGVNLTTHL
jgi:hypothetical protein